MWMHNVLLVTLILHCGYYEFTACSSLKKGSMNFSIYSWRNKTGHWTSKIYLDHDGPSPRGSELDSGIWLVDVQQSFEKSEAGLKTIINAILTAPPPMPGPGYIQFPGLGFYKLHTDVKVWDDARMACEAEGAHLAVLNSRAEVDALLALWQLHPTIRTDYLNSYSYVGYHDLPKPGNFVTLFDEPLASAGYDKWASGEPSGGGERCGSLTRAGDLNDMGCGTELPYFCEQSL